MASEPPKVLISYNQADHDWAEWIAGAIERAGYESILQAWHFRPGENFVLRMQETAAQTDFTVAVLSENYLKSEYTQREWATAVAQDATGKKRKLIPVRVAECTLTGLLSQIIYIDLVNLGEQDAERALLDGLKPSGKPARPPPFPGKRAEPSISTAPFPPSLASFQELVQSPEPDRRLLLLPPKVDRRLALVDAWEVRGPLETDRFTDLTLYKGHFFANDNPAALNRLQESEALRSGNKYTLEVAIRQWRSGIGAATPAVSAVLNPRRTTETLTIFVFARTLYGPVVIDDRVVAIDWPYNADSNPAFFRITVPATLPELVLETMVEVRLYHANLDLLDVIRLVVHVTADMDAETPPCRIDWPRSSNTEPRLDPDAVIRELTIRVSPAIDGYSFEFIFRRGDREVLVPFERKLKLGDLETLIAKVRDFWTTLVITNYESKLSVAMPTWNRYLGRLYELGTDAWDLLFGSRTGSQKGASETVGDLMGRTELADGSLVQVTYDGRLTDFVFPWSILHPPADPGTSVDPLRFWGSRYQVEQVWGGANKDRLEIEPVGVAVTIDPGFGEAQPEIDMFESFRAEAGSRLDLGAPIADRTNLYTALSGARHLYYFFCHGYAPAGPSLTRRDGIKVLREIIEALPVDQRKPWDTLLALTAKMDDESWIFIGDAQITESALRRERGYFSKRRPILFLNMCHSAALAPSMTSGLVRLFLDRDAAAIIGTESPMTPVFAHAFGNEVLNNLFRGDDIGTALWRARRHFLADNIRNPLGFVYTLYGRATVKLGSAPLITNARHEEASMR